MHPISNSTIQNALVLLRQGKSACQVATSLSIGYGTVCKYRNQYKENIPEPKTGRPTKVTKTTKRLLAQKFDTGQIKTLKEGQNIIKSIDGKNVHVESVRNYLKSEDLKAYVNQKKPDLTAKQIKKRYEFAKIYKNWTVEDWKHVMFSDETIFSCYGSFGRHFHYRKKDHKKIQPHQIQKTKQGGGGKLMMWGCMTYYGLGDACWVPGKIDADEYVDTLQKYVAASCDWYDMDHAKFIFQQDNASVHTSAKVRKFFKTNKINVLEWPSNSPDLNIIEHVWAYIKRQLDNYEEPPKNLDELWEHVQQIWETMPYNFIQELYESIPRQIEMLYKNKGGHIHY